MAKSTNLMLPQNANNAGVTFVNADSTTAKTLFTAGANDSNLKGLVITTDDTSSVNVQVKLRTGGVDYPLGTVRAVTLSGTDGAANAIDGLNSTAMPGLPVDGASKRYIPLMTGDTIKVNPVAAVTAGKTLWITALGENY